MEQQNQGILAPLLEMDHPEDVLLQMEPFARLMAEYQCAVMEIETKFKVLNREFSIRHDRNPIETIKTRIKEPVSIIQKLRRGGWEMTLPSIQEHIHDIAGIRVICSFPEDIYSLKEMLLRQDDIVLVREKDYIQNPKPNGYRSLHLIVDVPIFLSEGKKQIKAEVQFRTIAMDFWASLEHKLKYKKDIPNQEEIAARLKCCAEQSSSLDQQMQEIRHMLDKADRK